MSDHPTVTQLHTTLVARGHRLGVATVYQNLARLAESSLVSRFLDSQGLLRFDANLSPHHHLLCRSCGRILDVGLSEQHAARLAELTHDLAGVHGSWQLEDGQLELHGVCPACRQQRTVSHCSKGSAANQGPP
jgi:Fe2+ or Zn2+ uptake regulation protein